MRLLMRFLKPYRGLVAVTLLVLLVDNVGTLLVPTMLANMVNTGITTGDVDYILRNGLYMLIATGMASGGTVLGCYLSARLAANVACDIRNAVYDKSLELAASDFERFGTGSMITRSLNDINVIQQAVLQTIQLVLPVPFLAVAGIIFAWFIDPAMGTLLGVVVAIVLVAAVFTVANAAPIFMRLQSFIDRMNVVLRENIVGVRVIRAFNKEHHEEQRLDEVFSDYADNAIKVNHLFVGLDSSSFFLMNIAEVAVLWVGGNRVGAHAMQIGSISAVLEYAILILFFVMMRLMVIQPLPRPAACINRGQQVLEIEPSIVDGKRTLDTCAAEPVDSADAVAVFDHMSFRFDDADEDTLCNLSFTCRRGQTTAIVGSTGSGKSTVAKLLLRFHDATKGAIRLDGVDLHDLSQDEIRGRIAYVPQKAWLFSGTVASNLRFGNEGATEADMLHALEVAQSTFVLDQPQGLDTPVAQGGTNFSGGQRQRVAIGRAIVRDPKVFLMDEPLSNLDAKLRNQMRAELIKLRQRIDTTFIYVTHDQTEAMTLGDRIVVMKDGVVQQIATPQEVFNHPANIFVAGFIGVPQMNFFDAQLVRSGNGFTVKTEDMNVALAPETCSQLALNWDGGDVKEITAGVRPEQILLADKGEEGALQGTVEVTELMGSTEHVHVTAPDGQFVLIIPVVDLEAMGALKAGDPIWFKFEKNATHLFDKVSGKNLI